MMAIVILTQTYLICFFILSLNSLNTHERFPTLWNQAPSSIIEYPLVNSSSSSQTRLINPWLYLDRLGLYKILIDTTSSRMSFCSLTNSTNILFGLASQFSWQHDSNRLYSNGTNSISTNSWWASANYYLSVIPFLAAVDAGLIEQDAFEIVQYENFCSNFNQCFQQIPDVMLKWRRFFSNLLQSDYCKSDSIDDRIIDHCYLGPMWSAHVASIEQALPLIASKVSLLPSYNEQKFGLAWANLVDFIGMARENTNLINTNQYQDEYLPKRILTDDDQPPYISDLSHTVNQALELLFTIRLEWYPKLIKLWKRVTCNYEARQDAQHLLEIVATSKIKAIIYYIEALIKSYLFECDQ